MKKHEGMKTDKMSPKDFCEMEAVRYVAFRYGATPEQVLERYFVQCGIIAPCGAKDAEYSLTPNEIALFHDLGIVP
ncbi:MAG: hypothetical protein K2H49_05830 [Muribaculaceae bacterium]|nr:hypothetical protein [Muribaculaceae bacterium]